MSDRPVVARRVRITNKASAFCGEEGSAIRINQEQSTDHTVYDIIFDWDVSSIPKAFSITELEFLDE